MNQQNENRREFLKTRLVCRCAAAFIDCKSDTLAQKSGEDVLSLIKKNALPVGAEGMGAIDAPRTISWKTILAKESDEGEPMSISGTVFQTDAQNACARRFNLSLSHGHVWNLRQERRAQTREISWLDVDR